MGNHTGDFKATNGGTHWYSDNMMQTIIYLGTNWYFNAESKKKIIKPQPEWISLLS